LGNREKCKGKKTKTLSKPQKKKKNSTNKGNLSILEENAVGIPNCSSLLREFDDELLGNFQKIWISQR
jgi:hypothetical protein